MSDSEHNWKGALAGNSLTNGSKPGRLGQLQADRIKSDPLRYCRPALSGGDRHRLGQCTRGNDLAGGERRIDRVGREQAREMPQRREWAAQHVFAPAAVDQGAVASQINLERAKRSPPLVRPRRERLTRSDQ